MSSYTLRQGKFVTPLEENIEHHTNMNGLIENKNQPSIDVFYPRPNTVSLLLYKMNQVNYFLSKSRNKSL